MALVAEHTLVADKAAERGMGSNPTSVCGDHTQERQSCGNSKVPGAVQQTRGVTAKADTWDWVLWGGKQTGYTAKKNTDLKSSKNHGLNGKIPGAVKQTRCNRWRPESKVREAGRSEERRAGAKRGGLETGKGRNSFFFFFKKSLFFGLKRKAAAEQGFEPRSTAPSLILTPSALTTGPSPSHTNIISFVLFKENS